MYAAANRDTTQRERLIGLVRAVGADIQEHAEDIVGEYGGICDLGLSIDIPISNVDVPTIDISRGHVCSRAVQVFAQNT